MKQSTNQPDEETWSVGLFEQLNQVCLELNQHGHGLLTR